MKKIYGDVFGGGLTNGSTNGIGSGGGSIGAAFAPTDDTIEHIEVLERRVKELEQLLEYMAEASPQIYELTLGYKTRKKLGADDGHSND